MDSKYFKACDYDSLKENYERALQNPNFRYVAESTGLSGDKLMKHTSKLETSQEELTNCKNCPGLKFCKNRVKGFVYYPSVQEGKLSFNYVACKYKKELIALENGTCDFFEMPEKLKRASMKDIFMDDELRVPIIRWLKNFYDTYTDNPHQKGLYLHGSFGSGKTYLICAMLNELSKKHVDVLVAYYPQLLLSLKSSFDTDFATRIEKIKKASILFLDDIGAESVTAWSRDEILGTILQYRMDAALPTFFTSNLTIDDLEANLSVTKNSVDKVKARRIIERIKFLTTSMELVAKDRRN